LALGFRRPITQFKRVVTPRFLPLLTAAALLLAACATTERLSAANDVHGLLVAIRDNDRAAFDAHIDRAALEAEIQEVLLRQTRAAGLGDGVTGLGILMSGPLSRAAGGVLLRPDVFRAVADEYGYSADKPLPGTVRLAAALTPVGQDRVCAKDPGTGACLLTFAAEAGTWRLVAFDASRVLPKSSGGRR
jgi:hypothetical protein